MSIQIRQRSNPLAKFTGGLNNFWDQSAIGEDEAATVVNLEFTTKGSLASRPPIWAERDADGDAIGSPVADSAFDIIGTYVKLNGDRFLVVVTDESTYTYNIATKTYQLVAPFVASDCTQYQNNLVLCSTTTPGGHWDGTTLTIDNMPLLGGIELLQNRFFGYGVEGTETANTIYWSNITTAGLTETTSVWDWEDDAGSNFYVDIGNGDGQWVTAMAPGYNELVIFRNKSTYKYSFNEDPALGTMLSMYQDIGAENNRCVIKFDNAHYVLSGNTLYKFQSSLFYPLNAQKVRLDRNDSKDWRIEHAISVIGRRAIVWHAGNTYVLNLDTQTWSQWDSDLKPAYFVALPRRHEDINEELYYGVSGEIDQTVPVGASNVYPLLRMTTNSTMILDPAIYGTTIEPIRCYLRTRIYDFNTPVEWKRLYFWAADIATSKPIKATVTPVALTETPHVPTWDEISLDYEGEPTFKTWDDLSKETDSDPKYGTWDLLTSSDGGIETTIAGFPVYGKPQRVEAKFNNSLRFRRVFFELYLECDGTPVTSPVQIFSITPMVGVKAKIAKGAN
jgi:hypothetical protein